MDSVIASLTKNRRTTLERIEKFLSKEFFTDVNLYGKLYSSRKHVHTILHWDLTRARATEQQTEDAESEDGLEWKVAVPPRENFEPYKLGTSFGPTWSTHWFIIDIDIPEAWHGQEVHLIWDSGSEAMIWLPSQKAPLQGLSGGIDFQMRDCFVLTKNASSKDQRLELWIEVACNDLFGAGAGGMINPPDSNKTFAVKKAEIAIFRRNIFEIFTDFEILTGMAKHLPETDPRSFDAMYLANHIVNLMKTSSPDMDLSAIKQLTSNFFSNKNGGLQHRVFAFGHCHIDCAWLWPYDETIRKCGRSWASMIRLMEEYPDFRFVASSAQQFLWVKNYYPVLYEQIKIFVKKGQFIPVGGSWVEMDGNLPSGESFIRQFLYGQRFFKREFGQRCDVFWLPDTFGYSAQLPQIIKSAGLKYFVTQKLSWNLVNKFPHHNFIWRGIDGTEVLTHFPPGGSYGLSLTVEDTLKTVEKLEDKGRAHQSMLLYGYGDGGGGSTAAMIERGLRMKDIDGIPKVLLNETPTSFFKALEFEKRNLNTWSGELYLELHNGTYTTQAELKRKNREIQNLFRDIEFLEAVVFAFFGTQPESRETQWQDFLLQQFHDVLPGSSIGLVNQDANRIMDDLIDSLNESCTKALDFLSSTGSQSFFNATGATLSFKAAANEKTVFLLPPYCFASEKKFLQAQVYDFNIAQLTDKVVLENMFIAVTFDPTKGEIISMILKPTGNYGIEKEVISPGGAANRMVLFDDVPLYWDAWDCMDYHLEAKNSEKKNLQFHVLPDGIALDFALSDNCQITQKVTLAPNAPVVLVDCQVRWTEKHKFLKMEIDVNVTSENKKATYEIQHGHVERSAHRNTSWDWAKFEVCCQRWADLSEFGFGVAVLNLANHGFAVRDNTMTLSLLRSPKKPDENADMGLHRLQYAFMPHWGTFQEAGVIQQAMAINDTWNPLIFPAELTLSPTEGKWIGKLEGLIRFFEISHPAIILDAVKVAEDSIDPVIVVRLYESFGGSASGTFTTKLPLNAFQECDILENPIGEKIGSSGSFLMHLRAFEIKSFLLYLSNKFQET